MTGKTIARMNRGRKMARDFYRQEWHPVSTTLVVICLVEQQPARVSGNQIRLRIRVDLIPAHANGFRLDLLLDDSCVGIRGITASFPNPGYQAVFRRRQP